MKHLTLAISALAAFALSAGMAAAQMQPIPNPPEHHHMTMRHHVVHHVVHHHVVHHVKHK